MNLTNEKQIKELLARHGFRFSKSLGQNFLKEAWVPERIAESAGLDDNTGVIEIGPGIGCLTNELAQRAGKVVSIEMDNALKPVLAETMAEHDNVEVVFGDFLKTDLNKILDEKFPGMRTVACANLPYNITSPAITKLIQLRRFDTITVMIQREVAKRICGEPGSSDYGSFTVFVNWYAEPEMLFDVSPGCFMPPPKVTSSVIQLKMRDKPPVEVKDEELFFKVVRAAFGQRRKTLKNALSSVFSAFLSKDEIGELIVSLGHSETIRGETFGIPEFAALADGIHQLIKK